MATERERQTSNKAGVKSLAKKLDNSRHGFNEQPASRKIAGAFGHEERVRGAATNRPAARLIERKSRPSAA